MDWINYIKKSSYKNLEEMESDLSDIDLSEISLSTRSTPTSSRYFRTR